MHDAAPNRLPDDLSETCEQFVRWRQSRARGTRIPAELWNRAVLCAKAHGVARTANVLKVDYYALKRRIDPAGGHSRPPRSNGAAKEAPFVELSPLPPAPSTECIVEFEDGKGARLHLRWNGPGLPDVTALSRGFWNGR